MLRRFTSPRVRQQRRRRLALRLLLACACGAALLVLISQAARMPVVLVSEITVSGNRAISQNDLANAARKELEGTYLWGLIPKRNIFFYPAERIEKKLLDDFPRIARVNVRRAGLRVVSVFVTERTAAGLWCAEEINQCFSIDTDGFAFAAAPRLSGAALLTFYSPEHAPTLYSYVASPEDFHALQKFAGDLRSLDLFVASFIIFSDHGEAILREDTRIIFNRALVYNDALRALADVLQSQEFKNAGLSMGQLEYIDVRFGNKIYYKVRQQ